EFAAFLEFSEFTITSGFIAGTNTLDFVALNAPVNSFGPTGLRVEMHGIIELPNEAPFMFKQPEPRKIVKVGDETSLTVVAYGTAPLTYQWRRDGADVPGATSAKLVLTDVKMIQEGSYTVLIT